MIVCPACLNGEFTCKVRTIIASWRGGAVAYQCLICAGCYDIVIVKRYDQELGSETYVSDLRRSKKVDRAKGWFYSDEGPSHEESA